MYSASSSTSAAIFSRSRANENESSVMVVRKCAHLVLIPCTRTYSAAPRSGFGVGDGQDLAAICSSNTGSDSRSNSELISARSSGYSFQVPRSY